MLVDLDTGKNNFNGTNTIKLNYITFTIENIEVNRRYNVTIRASNSAGSTTSYVTISECSYII